jgi:L-2-hydroxyglutarate oxidase
MEDFCIIGGGIVGLASALALLERCPGAGLVLLEKEAGLARHQTGRNSGVIHSGIYYAPGSLKARLCREGAEATLTFCREHAIAHEVCGKLIVATNQAELARLEDLRQRAGENGIACESIDGAELRRREPAISGLAALHVPSTGIADYPAMCEAMAARIVAMGGRIEFGVRVDAIAEETGAVTVRAGDRAWTSARLVVCAGLQADRLARLGGIAPDFRIVPFRGEYFRLREDKSHVAQALIYPVPDPDLPFLGIHLTRTIDGGMTIGPSAILGLAREDYRRFGVDFADLAASLAFPGFWRMLAGNLGPGLAELRRALSRRAYLAAARKYCPELELADLRPEPAGIRAQAVMRDGSMVSDFLLRETPRALHVCNAPSPAATSALPIGAMIASRVLESRSKLR